MIERVILLSCDHPGCQVGWNEDLKFISIDDAKREGWAVSRNRKNFYCPKCAPKHRHTGSLGWKGVCGYR